MIVVLPICHKDAHLAVKNLELCERWGDTNLPFTCVIHHPNIFDPSVVQPLTERIFRNVILNSYSEPGEIEWPRGANRAWQEAARFVKARSKMPWFWWEADAVPLEPRWLATLADAYHKGEKPFAGFVNHGRGYMNGVGIYPYNVSSYLPMAMRVHDKPFDLVAGVVDRVLPHVTPLNHLIVHHMKEAGGEPGRSFLSLSDIPEGAVLFHGADDTLAPLLMERHKPGMLRNLLEMGRKAMQPSPQAPATFFMGPDYGDIIYSLGVMRAMGGGHLQLSANLCIDTRNKPREPFTKERFQFLSPLLSAQSYIRSLQYVRACPAGAANLNRFRETYDRWASKVPTDVPPSLQRFMSDTFDLSPLDEAVPWLHCDPVQVPGRDIAVARSLRYRRLLFPWKELAASLSDRMFFLGLPSEHQDWTAQTGAKIPHIEVQDALELAAYVNGARLFMGNQSFPFALAEAMKKSAVQESWLRRPDCLFARPTLLTREIDPRVILSFVDRMDST